MKLEESDLLEIEQYAALAFSPEQVEVIMGFAKGTVSEEKTAEDAFMRGFLKTEAEVWKSIIEHAKAGSSPAQTLAVKRIEQTRNNLW